MKRVEAAVALALILAAASMLLPAYSQPTLTASMPNVYAHPGGVYTVRGTASAGELVVVEFTASNRDTFSHNFTVTATGPYSFDVTVPEDLEPDVYTVKIRVGERVVSSLRVVVSHMTAGERLQNMIQSIIRTRQALEAYMAEFQEEGEDVPEAVLNGYRDAQEALQMARRYYGDGQYAAALVQARRAQTKFQRAFKAISEPQPPVSDTQPSPEILRAIAAYENLRSLSIRLAENGYNTTALDGALDKIEGLLEEAEEKHRQGDYDGSQRALKAAVEAMNRIRARIEELSQQVKTRLASRYEERLRTRLNEMRTALSLYQDRVTDQEKTQALESLTTTDQKLQQLEDALQVGRVEMDDIQDISNDIEEAVSKIGDEDTRNTLSDMDRTSAWLEAWRNRVATSDEVNPKVKFQLQNHSRLLDYLRQKLVNSTATQPGKEPNDSLSSSNEGSTNTKATPINKDGTSP